MNGAIAAARHADREGGREAHRRQLRQGLGVHEAHGRAEAADREGRETPGCGARGGAWLDGEGIGRAGLRYMVGHPLDALAVLTALALPTAAYMALYCMGFG